MKSDHCKITTLAKLKATPISIAHVLILKTINNLVITEIYFTKIIQSYSVFHGNYSYTKLVFYLFLVTLQTKDKYFQDLKFKQKRLIIILSLLVKGIANTSGT